MSSYWISKAQLTIYMGCTVETWLYSAFCLYTRLSPTRYLKVAKYCKIYLVQPKIFLDSPIHGEQCGGRNLPWRLMYSDIDISDCHNTWTAVASVWIGKIFRPAPFFPRMSDGREPTRPAVAWIYSVYECWSLYTKNTGHGYPNADNVRSGPRSRTCTLVNLGRVAVSS